MAQSIQEKRDLAWQYGRKQAVLQLYGWQYAPQVLPLQDLELSAFTLQLSRAAIARGEFFHGTHVEDRLDALMQQHGYCDEIPYAEGFAAYFPPTVADIVLAEVEESLAETCECYADEYATFFQPEAGGYQYLHDVVADALYRQAIPRTPSVERALDWLAAHAHAFRPPVGGPAPTAAPAAEVLALPGPGADPWRAILAAGRTQQEIEAVLVAVRLLAPDDTGRLVPTLEGKPGAWVGAIMALQKAYYLTRNQGGIARALAASYGDVVSERALQTGLKEHNDVHMNYYHLALVHVQP